MLPLSDGLPVRRFPVVTVALIAANLALWIQPQCVPRPYALLTPFRTG
jgi:hypothetical protein